MTIGINAGSTRDYCVTVVAALGVCLSTWWILRKKEKEDTLPPLVSLTRRQVAQYWLDGMFWKAILVAGKEAQEKWGTSVFRMRGTGFFDPPSVMCIDSTYVDALLGANGLEKSYECYEALVYAFGQGQQNLVVRKMHENYNEIRKPIMNFFSLSNIGKRLECCRGKVEEFLQLWDDAAERQTTIELGTTFCDLTMDVLGIACLNYDFQAVSGADNAGTRMMHAGPWLMEECGNKQRFIPFRKYMTLLPDVKKAERLMKENLQFCKDVLQSRREEIAANKNSTSGELLLDTFFRCPYESEDNRAADVVTFLLAGHETTGHQLALCIYALMKSPESLAKAQDEVDRVLGDARICRHSMLKDLRYTMACFLESLRLWPVTPEGSPRVVEEPLNIQGYELPSGTQITIPNIAVLRSKRWGADSELYVPERWLDNSPKAQELRKTFTGFSYGARTCAGRTFAEQEAKFLLSTILRNYEFSPVQLPPEGREMIYHVTARAREGVHVRVRRRD